MRLLAILIITAVLAAGLLGCAEERLHCPPARPNHVTPLGQSVAVPPWLTVTDIALLDQVADWNPLPPGWVLVVEPQDYELRAACFYDCKQVRFGWEPSQLWLDYILGHEAGHAWTGDPCYGHPPSQCGGF